jgi:hypothetical protein
MGQLAAKLSEVKPVPSMTSKERSVRMAACMTRGPEDCVCDLMGADGPCSRHVAK